MHHRAPPGSRTLSTSMSPAAIAPAHRAGAPGRRFAELDAYRGISALLIVVLHAYTKPGITIDLLEHLTFTHVFDRRHFLTTIGQAWSVGDEAMFYLFLAGFGPLACVACRRLAAPQARGALLAGATGLLCVASLGYKWWAFAIARLPLGGSSEYLGSLARLDTFALGMLLAVGAAVAGAR